MPIRFHMLICGILASLSAAMEPEDLFGQRFTQNAASVEAVSAGFCCGNRVLIRFGSHTFRDEGRTGRGLAGLYAVAVANNDVLIDAHYNTFTTPGASEGFARDIDALPAGAFVVVAARGIAQNMFDQRGQNALRLLGAEKGLLGQERGASYLCIGLKGLASGKAIERAGKREVRFKGENTGRKMAFNFPKKPPPVLRREPGRHEGLMFDPLEVLYYIPARFDPAKAQYLFAIHGAGCWGRTGAIKHLEDFQDLADRENLVVIAPAFAPVLNWPCDRNRDIRNGKWNDPRIVRDKYLSRKIALINPDNDMRSDIKLIEIFEFFSRNLMKREKFHLYGISGGGQFVSRFIVFHPELVDKVAIASAGTFLFPDFEHDYPNGLNMKNIKTAYGEQINTDGLLLDKAQFNKQLSNLLLLKVFLIAGAKETWLTNPNVTWQGKSTLERTRNYYAAMKQEHVRQKKLGNLPPSSQFQFELHVLPGTAHEVYPCTAMVKKLFFPPE